MGRPPDQRRITIINHYRLSDWGHPNKRLTPAFVDQIEACQSDEARRLILGVSERWEWEEFDEEARPGRPRDR